jgi:hypothetical protein
VGLVQALQECSGDVKSIEISIFEILFLRLVQSKLNLGLMGIGG